MISSFKDYDALCKEAAAQIEADEFRIKQKGSSMWNEYNLNQRFPDFDGGTNRLRMLLKAASDNGLSVSLSMVSSSDFLSANIWVSFDKKGSESIAY